MNKNTNSPVLPVPFGDAMKISLNNYYDVLKQNIGGLGASEFLQLKSVADIVDISKTKNDDDGYEWYSYYNMLNRADLEIEPVSVSGEAMVGVAKISDIYGRFLAKLSQFVLRKELSTDDQRKKNDLDVEIESIRTQMNNLSNQDLVNWKNYCELRGINPADTGRYNQWAEIYGHADKLSNLLDQLTEKNFDIIQIVSKTYSDPDDQDIVDALVSYKRSAMKMCYPTTPDYLYLPTRINLQYLSTLPILSTALYDARYYFTFNMDPMTIKTTGAGAINAAFSHNTSESNSIITDWSASGSLGYFFIKVNASASEHQAISQDFSTATEINLLSKAAFRVQINYGPWFNAALFDSKYIKENPGSFMEFFGANGSLLYYPTSLVMVRGFSVEFKNTQSWTYDYQRSFSASAGGGFNIFGINFGGSHSYSENTKEHKIDVESTSLKISDDEDTIRFMGYAVAKNKLLTETMNERFPFQPK